MVSYRHPYHHSAWGGSVNPGPPMLDTALVIDDDAPVRRLVHRMLEPEVCRVLEAPDAETGLRLIEREDPRVDVVLTDWIMPGLHGLDVVEVLHEYRPSLPVAVISAYTSTIHPIVLRGSRIVILEKPFTIDQVQRAVAQMIARAAKARNGAREMRDQATQVRERNAVLREQSSELRSRVDLVTAAWNLHHSRRGHRDETPTGPDVEEQL
jgi:DNA-binding NtrC family response regulator